jgi:hypothetical protein
MDGLYQLLAHLLNNLSGALMARFRRWIDRQPQRDFTDASLLDKAGRLLMMVAVLLLVLGPLGWLIWR